MARYHITALCTVILCVILGPPTARAAGSTPCPGQLYSEIPGGPKYRITDLMVMNTTCAVGRRLSRSLPPYRVLKPRQADGFHCAATMYYAEPQQPLDDGYQEYTCRQHRKIVRWNVEVPSEI